MRLSLRSLTIAVLIGLGGATTASAEISESPANRIGRWTGYGWSEGYHAYDECPSCGHRGHGFHHHHGGKARHQPEPYSYGPPRIVSTGAGPFAESASPPWQPFQAPLGKVKTSTKAVPNNRQFLKTAEPRGLREISLPELVSPSTKVVPLPAPPTQVHAASQTAALQESSQLYPLPVSPAMAAKPATSPAQLPGRYPLAR